MGLLNSDFGKLLFGHTTMMKDREIARQAERYEGLLGGMGSPATAGPPSLMGDATSYPYQEEVGPSGLMGGQVTPEQFGAQAAAIPGYKDFGANLMMQGMRGDQAMDRQQQGQQFGMNNMSMAQRLQDQQRQQQMALAENQMVENFQTKFNNATEPYQTNIRAAETVDQLYPDKASYESGTGNRQLATVMKFMKVQNDGGAFMSDDMQNLARANGIKGSISDYWNWFTSEGFKEPGVIEDMHMILRKQAIVDSQKITEQATSLVEAVPGLRGYMPQITRGAGMGYAAPTGTGSTKRDLSGFTERVN